MDAANGKEAETGKAKKETLRMCVVCRRMLDKKALLRVVMDKSGTIALDPGGKRQGRGAYVCGDEACLARMVKTKALNRAFRCDAGGVYDEIYAYYGREKPKRP